MKQTIDNNNMQLKKLLRQSVIKSVSYIQTMLEILQNMDDMTLEQARVKLEKERERYLKKNNGVEIINH